VSKVKLPARFAIPVGLAVAVVTVACGSKNSEESKLPNTPRPSESGAPPPENPLAVLKEPFKKDPKMQIQQAWTSDFEKEHHAIDYIKGDIDNSKTWKSFEVNAVADGFACANPPSRQGNAVWMEHHIGNDLSKQLLGYTYYGHLAKIEGNIPACESKEKPIFEKQDTKVGDAGSTGAPDAAWIHLHFAVKDANQNPIDPYDLKKARDVYPNPNFSNLKEKPCGPNALFIDCYPKGAVIAGPKSPNSQISGKVNEKKVESQLEKGWTRLKSLTLPYQIDYPSNWTWIQTKNSFYGNLPNHAWPMVSVDSRAVSNWINLDDYKDAVLKASYQDVRFTATPNQSIDGQKAWRLDSANPAYYDIPPTRNVGYITIKDGKAWFIFFEAYNSEFDQNLPTFEKMLESFKFLK